MRSQRFFHDSIYIKSFVFRALHAAAVVTDLLQSSNSSKPMEVEEIPDEFEEDSEEEEVKLSSSDVGRFWRVYWTVRNIKEPGESVVVSEPFCRLPSKK